MVQNVNPDIIFIRAYNGILIPIAKVNLVTVDPNSGKVAQEMPLINCIEDLVQYNLNSFEKVKEHWSDLESYELIKKA